MIKKCVKQILKYYILLKFYTIKLWRIKKIRKLAEVCYFLMATPCHGNLGDHAIVYAEKELLRKCNKLDKVIEISNLEYKIIKKVLRKYINTRDIILIDGGGNMGTLWKNEDDKISEIIKEYSKNQIIIFPQTCFYEDSSEAEQRLLRNKKIYAENQHMTIYLRDRQSFEFCRRHFGEEICKFAPDIVLYLNKNKNIKRYEKCILCLREDKEKVLSLEEAELLRQKLQKRGIKVKNVSTVMPYNVYATFRNLELKRIWKKFSTSQLVITDRLHGMLFAVITGTPCLAVDNISKKVSGVYEWIAEKNNIKICDNLDTVLENIDNLVKINSSECTTELLRNGFEEILREVCESGRSRV